MTAARPCERSVDGLRAHVEAFERSPRGGGPRHLVSILDTTATDEGLADEKHALAEPGDDARVPPAAGVRGVVLSGRVHTAAGTVAAPVRWWFFGEDALAGAERLVARELTVVSQRLPASAELRRWRHEDVTYLVPLEATAETTQTYVVQGSEEEARFAHGLGTPRADRVTLTATVEASRTVGGQVRTFSPGLYGIALDTEPLPPLLPGGPVRPAFAVHFDKAIARGEDAPPGGVGIPFEEDDEITVSWRAERYKRLNGDTDGPLAPVIVTAKADGSPKLDDNVPYGLAGPPAVWRVTRMDTGEAVKATLVGADQLKVKFGANDELAVDDEVALWLQARVG